MINLWDILKYIFFYKWVKKSKKGVEIKIDDLKLNNEGFYLIRKFESFSDKSYTDSVGVWTIGYGTTIYPNGKKVKRNQICTYDQAREWFKYDIENRREKPLREVLKKIDLKLNENEFSALVSFVYNLGMRWVNGKEDCSMRRAMELKDKKAMAAAFENFTRAGGVKLKGLVKRRKAERKLFTKKA